MEIFQMPTSKKVQKPTSKATYRSSRKNHQRKYKEPFVNIFQKDLKWALKQKPTVYKLWGECWDSDPYGSRWMPLKTSLKDRNLRYAKKALREAGLFDFQTKMQILENKRYYETYVINLHGGRTTYQRTLQQNSVIENTEGGTENAEDGIENAEDGIENAEDGTDNSAQQGLKDAKSINPEASTNVSPTPHQHLKGGGEACEAEKIAQKARSFSCASPPQEGEIGIRSALSAELMVGEIGGGQAPHTPHARPPQLDSESEAYSVKGAPSGRVPTGKPLTEPPPSDQYEQPRGARGECLLSSPLSTNVSHSPSTLANASARSELKANSSELMQKSELETSERLDLEGQKTSLCHLEASKTQNEPYDDLNPDPEVQDAYKAFFERTRAIIAEKIGDNAKTKEAKQFVKEYRMKKRQQELSQLQNPSKDAEPEMPF